MLIDLTNQLRRQGRSIDDALLEACPIRMRPVLMTSLTVIISMLPAALGTGEGSDINVPLAVAIIGGMVSSILLTLIVSLLCIHWLKTGWCIFNIGQINLTGKNR